LLAAPASTPRRSSSLSSLPATRFRTRTSSLSKLQDLAGAPCSLKPTLVTLQALLKAQAALNLEDVLERRNAADAKIVVGLKALAAARAELDALELELKSGLQARFGECRSARSRLWRSPAAPSVLPAFVPEGLSRVFLCPGVLVTVFDVCLDHAEIPHFWSGLFAGLVRDLYPVSKPELEPLVLHLLSDATQSVVAKETARWSKKRMPLARTPMWREGPVFEMFSAFGRHAGASVRDAIEAEMRKIGRGSTDLDTDPLSVRDDVERARKGSGLRRVPQMGGSPDRHWGGGRGHGGGQG
jgi:hypothetical protein